MLIKSIMRVILLPIIFLGVALTSISAADYNLRATANSNENDEDYDGLVVFKNYVESASNGAISVEIIPSFTPTIPYSRASETLHIRPISLL